MKSKILILLLILFVSFSLNALIEPNVMKPLLEKLIFNSVSILVGLSIAVVGIFLSSINTVYLSIYRLTKSKKKKVRLSVRLGLRGRSWDLALGSKGPKRVDRVYIARHMAPATT